jgi:aspartyl protease family protein
MGDGVVSDETGYALIYALLILLPVSALVARRLPLSTVVKYALAWVAIFGVGLLAVLLYQRMAGG